MAIDFSAVTRVADTWNIGTGGGSVRRGRDREADDRIRTIPQIQIGRTRACSPSRPGPGPGFVSPGRDVAAAAKFFQAFLQQPPPDGCSPPAFRFARRCMTE